MLKLQRLHIDIERGHLPVVCTSCAVWAGRSSGWLLNRRATQYASPPSNARHQPQQQREQGVQTGDGLLCPAAAA